VAGTLAGFLAFQAALRGGRAISAISLMNASAALGYGIVGLHESPTPGPNPSQPRCAQHVQPPHACERTQEQRQRVTRSSHVGAAMQPSSPADGLIMRGPCGTDAPTFALHA
jgi:hypothetical protein